MDDGKAYLTTHAVDRFFQRVGGDRQACLGSLRRSRPAPPWMVRASRRYVRPGKPRNTAWNGTPRDYRIDEANGAIFVLIGRAVVTVFALASVVEL